MELLRGKACQNAHISHTAEGGTVCMGFWRGCALRKAERSLLGGAKRVGNA